MGLNPNTKYCRQVDLFSKDVSQLVSFYVCGWMDILYNI